MATLALHQLFCHAAIFLWRRAERKDPRWRRSRGGRRGRRWLIRVNQRGGRWLGRGSYGGEADLTALLGTIDPSIFPFTLPHLLYCLGWSNNRGRSPISEKLAGEKFFLQVEAKFSTSVVLRTETVSPLGIGSWATEAYTFAKTTIMSQCFYTLRFQ